MDPRPTDPIARLRDICLSFAGATEKISHGEPSWIIGGRQFASLDDHHHGADRLAVWCAAPPGAQEVLVDGNPERFFRPPYVGHRGWVAMRIDRDPDWDEVASIVADAVETVAARRRRRR